MYICHANYMSSVVNRTTQLDIPVSETEPVRVSVASHPDRGESQYDMHFGLELGLVLSGVTRRHYQGHSRLVGRGQVWFCGMWESHGFEVVKAPCEVIVLVIWPPLLAQLRFEEAPNLEWMAPFAVKPSERPQVAPSKKNIFLEQAVQLKRLTAPSTPAEKIKIRLCLLNILIMVLENCPVFRTGTANPGPEHWNRLNRTAHMVFESRSFISVKRAARECGLNRNLFSRLFKKWMGIKFVDFALRYRLKLAVGQLLSGNDPAKTIARQCGFVNTSHFHRVFRKYYGCSPSGFRRQHVNRHQV